MGTMEKVTNSIAKMARDAFKNHEATVTNLDERTQILTWAAPGSSMYSAEYIIRRNVLIVLGDMGNAIYMWSAPISIEKLAAYSLDYFAGKIQASPSGQYGEQWYPERARDRLDEWVEQGKYDPSEDSDAMDDYERRKEIVYGSSDHMIDDAISSAESQQDWSRWLEQNGSEAFGLDWWEWGSIGVGTNAQTQYHWHGIRAAAAWLKDHA